MRSGHGADSEPAPDNSQTLTNPETTRERTAYAHAPRQRGSAAASPTSAADADHAPSASSTADATRRDRRDAARDEASAERATPSGASGTPAPGEKTAMFSSLRIRNYRLFATGQLISNTGTWMQRIAQDWLVFSLTGSATAVGITIALQFLPMMLFGLYGGVIADRYPKRRLLFLTQSAMGLTGLALAALTLSGHVHVSHVYALAFVLGMATVVDNPARQTFVSELVGPAQLANAISLNAANFQSARLIGPAVAGAMIGAVGSGWAFLFNGLSFVAPLTCMALMRTEELHPTKPVPRRRGDLREGLRYVTSHPELIWPIVLVGFVGTFGFNFPIWLTAFVDDVYHAGPGTYGTLNTMMAVGSVAGALLAARRRSPRMRMLVGVALLFGLLMVAASLSPVLWLFGALMLPVGMLGLTFNVSANSSVQLACDPAMRGRVMSLYMMVFLGGTPLGGPLMGWLTDAFGARASLIAGGGVSALAAVAVGLLLARAGGLRLRVSLRPGRPHVTFVPRESREGAKDLVTAS